MAVGLSTGVLYSSPSGHDYGYKDSVTPVVFQAAGPDAASIRGLIDQFRTALGGVDNLNVPGPLESGRREINWDGGGSTATAIVPTPFTGFLNNRGALFTTPGSGFVQAPVEGLADTFGNPAFATGFQAFSPVRLFSAIESNVTHVEFFIPGGGDIAATTTGFGAVFADVDQPNGQPYTHGSKDASTFVFFYDRKGRLIYRSAVPPSPGDASLSFFGAVFPDARVARVAIKSGNVELSAYPEGRRDAVVMDDFIYGEPKELVR
jgi:hypothetical protein